MPVRNCGVVLLLFVSLAKDVMGIVDRGCGPHTNMSFMHTPIGLHRPSCPLRTLIRACILLQGTWLVAAGGVTYTVGGTIYALRWPNPWPKTFGYHEIFHAATILASVFHFSAVSARDGSHSADPLAAGPIMPACFMTCSVAQP